MDSSNPLRSLAPTVDVDVVLVLARTRGTVTGARVAHRAGRSYAQVRKSLHRRVGTGLVLAESHGNSVSYQLNRDHVLAGYVEAAADSAHELEVRITRHVGSWELPPAGLVLFGSFARRDGNENSDIDLLLIRPDAIEEDDARWTTQRHDLAHAVRQWSGNDTQIVEMSAGELATATEHEEDLITNLRRDGVVVSQVRRRSIYGKTKGPGSQVRW
jgi:hypothetical protein